MSLLKDYETTIANTQIKLIKARDKLLNSVERDQAEKLRKQTINKKFKEQKILFLKSAKSFKEILERVLNEKEVTKKSFETSKLKLNKLNKLDDNYKNIVIETYYPFVFPLIETINHFAKSKKFVVKKKDFELIHKIKRNNQVFSSGSLFDVFA